MILAAVKAVVPMQYEKVEEITKKKKKDEKIGESSEMLGKYPNKPENMRTLPPSLPGLVFESLEVPTNLARQLCVCHFPSIWIQGRNSA